MPTPIERYEDLLRSGRFQPDAAQARAAQALERLYRELKDYRPGRRLFSFGASSGDSAPKGIYIHGDVGRGKSLLMDLFFESATTQKKRRVHFNAFMT
jgi:cell division protein ZapE